MRVVLLLEKLEYSCFRFGPCAKRAALERLALERGEETHWEHRPHADELGVQYAHGRGHGGLVSAACKIP